MDETPPAVSAAAKLLEKLIDPGMLLALSSQSGLQVTPVVFQSLEQEGRWKPKSLFGEKHTEREFELLHQRNAKKGADPPIPVGKAQAGNGLKPAYWGSLIEFNADLFRIHILGAVGASSFTVDAKWWGDGLEIWAGYAGLRSATGFGSLYNDTAAVTLHALPFGNYYPALILIAWSGWVNPYLDTYREFRGGMVLSADGTMPATSPASTVPSPVGSPLTSLPAYMHVWTRGNDPAQDLPWNGNSFVLEAGNESRSPLPRQDWKRG